MGRDASRRRKSRLLSPIRSGSAFTLLEELLLELLPIAIQTVSRENFSYAAKIDGVCFDELKHACFIFCTACLERDADNMLSGKDPSSSSLHALFVTRD